MWSSTWILLPHLPGCHAQVQLFHQLILAKRDYRKILLMFRDPHHPVRSSSGLETWLHSWYLCLFFRAWTRQTWLPVLTHLVAIVFFFVFFIRIVCKVTWTAPLPLQIQKDFHIFSLMKDTKHNQVNFQYQYAPNHERPHMLYP